jgi:hypothetical protein
MSPRQDLIDQRNYERTGELTFSLLKKHGGDVAAASKELAQILWYDDALADAIECYYNVRPGDRDYEFGVEKWVEMCAEGAP